VSIEKNLGSFAAPPCEFGHSLTDYYSYFFLPPRTLEVPILLVVIFEITYLVHKRRSVNFCGMYFDDGVRVNNTAFMSCMLRNSIRSLATVLLVMGIVVNFNLFSSETLVEGKRLPSRNSIVVARSSRLSECTTEYVFFCSSFPPCHTEQID
jgi:hypothetical protein